jgi:Lipocalin-like domain
MTYNPRTIALMSIFVLDGHYPEGGTDETNFQYPVLLALTTFLPSFAAAQQKSLKDQLIGTWTLVSWEGTRADGTKYRDFGENPKGLNTFDANGQFSAIFMRPDLPKIASSDRSKATADEAQAILQGALTYFGTYTVMEADNIISLHLDGTTFPNMSTEAKRLVTFISADELRYRNPSSASGGQIELVWKRAKR